MEKERFVLKIEEKICEQLGENYYTEIREVYKNNGVKLTGLIITKEGCNLSPTIYLDSFYDAFEGGTSFETVCDSIVHMYLEEVPKTNVDMQFFENFEQVKDRICFRLVNYKKNKEALQDFPYVPYLDLAICFYFAYNDSVLGNGFIKITNQHVQHWKIDTKELMVYAMENTPRLFPGEIIPIDTIVDEIYESILADGDSNLDAVFQEEQEELKHKSLMHIVTNRQRTQGAICLLYPEILDGLQERFATNLYILPSSIHEVILLPDNGTADIRELRQMVREVNSTQVDETEQLSDNVYYFERETTKIKLL